MKARSLVLPTAAALILSANAFAAKPLVVMSWNVENFTDPFDDPFIAADFDDKGASKESSALEAMARAIHLADPDIIALQEIEGDRAVKFFLDEYLPGNEYKYYASVPSVTWFQNCVVASKVPLGLITSFREIEVKNEVLGKSDNRYNSRLLAVEVMPSPDYKFTLVDLHLKSGGDAEDPVWRSAQITLLKKHFADLMRLDPEANILVVGDMNLEPTSTEYGLLTGGIEPALIDSTAGTGISTHPARGPRHQYDYILYNEAMGPEIEPGSAGIAHAVSFADLSEASDHLPMIVTINPTDR